MGRRKNSSVRSGRVIARVIPGTIIEIGYEGRTRLIKPITVIPKR